MVRQFVSKAQPCLSLRYTESVGTTKIKKKIGQMHIEVTGLKK